MVAEPDHYRDQRSPPATKKRLEAATTILASGGTTDDPYLIAIIEAQRIFTLTGRPTWPWEVDELPDDWRDAMKAYAVDVDRKQAKIHKRANKRG